MTSPKFAGGANLIALTDRIDRILKVCGNDRTPCHGEHRQQHYSVIPTARCNETSWSTLDHTAADYQSFHKATPVSSLIRQRPTTLPPENISPAPKCRTDENRPLVR